MQNGIGCGTIISIALCTWAFITFGPLTVAATALVLFLIISIISGKL